MSRGAYRRNEYRILTDEIAAIKLSNGMEAIVDLRNLHRLLQYHWYAYLHHRTWRPATKLVSTGKPIFMHRLLLPFIPLIDHKNENGLDNRLCNLRRATDAQNKANRSCNRGVAFNKSTRRWQAYITVNGKRQWEYFDTEAEALEWRHRKELELLGEFAPNRTLQ